MHEMTEDHSAQDKSQSKEDVGTLGRRDVERVHSSAHQMMCLKTSKLDNGDCVFVAILAVIRVFESTLFGLAVKVFAGSCDKRIIFLIKD